MYRPNPLLPDVRLRRALKEIYVTDQISADGRVDTLRCSRDIAFGEPARYDN
jgi:hypothetical protein